MKDILILALIPFVVGCAVTQAQTVKQAAGEIAPRPRVLNDEASEQSQKGLPRSPQQSSDTEVPTGSSGTDSGQSLQPQCYKLLPVTYRMGSPDRSRMCRVLHRVLNSSCDEGPMVCGIHFPPDSKFTTPEWTPLSLDGNMDLIEKLVRGAALRLERFNPGASDRAWQLVSAALRDPERRPFASLQTASVDVFNRGEPELVYQLTLNSCSAARNQTFKLDPAIYIAKQAKVLEMPTSRARAEHGEDPFVGAHVLDPFPADLFTFDDRVFEFRWSPEPWVREVRWNYSDVFDKPLVSARTACQFEYQGE